MTTLTTTTTLEQYFAPYRAKVIGARQSFETPYGIKPLIYADWTASGRLYQPIEALMEQEIAPFVGNTHTETTVTGSAMTAAYHEAKRLIKRHCGARESDVLIASHSGMTGVVNKFQRILGLKLHEQFRGRVKLAPNERPIVLVSHMEHHSNQTSWLETIADVEVIAPGADGLMDMEHLKELLARYADRPLKIAAITSCSNVTGLLTPYHEVAEIMHRAGGLCFVDFACSAPYIHINMRPEGEPLRHLDAIYFSPHKFLGGPGSSGVLIFDAALYKNRVPDDPGGGTVDWTNPWGEHKYVEEIEAREDGGTPAFLQTIRAAMAVRLKEQMGVEKILEREHELLERIWQRLDRIPNLHLLAGQHRDRLGVISFYIDNLHYNLGVSLLNDRFGVQVRGGCSCAGTYGHYLLNVTPEYSKSITSLIDHGDTSTKPGWIRMSIHPVMSDAELDYVLDAIEELAANFQAWKADYVHLPRTNEYEHHSHRKAEQVLVRDWFSCSL